MPSIAEIARYIDDYLRIREIEDWPNALNGLQIQNSGHVTKIGAAVDVSSRVLEAAVENDIALFSAHLPLDIHPKIGNNAQLAALLGLKSMQPFLKEKGQLTGLKGRASLPREDLVRKLRKVLGGSVNAFNFGPNKAKTIGIVTGGAGSEIYNVAHEQIDTFITGEAPHWAAVAAEELGINLI